MIYIVIYKNKLTGGLFILNKDYKMYPLTNKFIHHISVDNDYNTASILTKKTKDIFVKVASLYINCYLKINFDLKNIDSECLLDYESFIPIDIDTLKIQCVKNFYNYYIHYLYYLYKKNMVYHNLNENILIEALTKINKNFKPFELNYV